MKKYVGLLASVGLAGVPVMAHAAPTLSEVLGASEITAAGYVDGSYVDGFNDGKTIAGHAFDTNSNTFELNQAALTLSYLPTDGFGGLVNVIAGSDAKVINGSYGNGNGDFALTQGYVQWAHGAFTIIGGRFVTLAGAEVIDDTKNTNISRSFLFQLAEPLVHTGVRGSYKISDPITVYAGISNAASSGAAEDPNKSKTLETGVTFAPSTTLSFALTNYYGVDSTVFDPATAKPLNSVKNDYLDGVASWQVTTALQLVANGDYARFVGSGADSYVAGIAVYANYQFTDSWKGSLRGEYLETKNALFVPKDNGKTSLEEITATADYSATKSFDVLGEFRYDFAGEKVYPDSDFPSGGPSPAPYFTDNSAKSQGEVLIKAIWKFGTPVPTAS